MKRLGSGEVLLHIGPHKTGSTTLQLGFHRNRERLREQGVHYAGPSSQPMTAAMVAATGTLLPTQAPEMAGTWDELVDEVHAVDADRTVISSEFFCEADATRTTQLLDRLGDRTQVVITLRPLARILASQWQQFVQNRLATGYPDWLEAVLGDVGTAETPSFWKRHRHDELVRRWAACAGPGRVTVVVLDEGDPEALLRTFEELVTVEAGTLDPGDVSANRSLRHAEVELLRRFNEQWRSHGWSEADYTRLVRFGAVRHLQARRPGEDEARILTPQWAVSRAQEVSARAVTAVSETGVEVIGDLQSLTEGLPAAAVGTNDPADTVPLEVAARFAAGLALRVAQLSTRPLPPGRQPGPLEAHVRQLRAQLTDPPPPRPATGDRVDQVSGAVLLRAVARGAADQVRRGRPGGSRDAR
ncbi:MAG: hypothetical protein AVDCRST_MAG36-2829 [uncultured Nocardioidaceae bacterium]|uniref:Sulfotransferase family protein n=1 Tax=uncultured Nocardioidaceae bacterium TaxID=253824 RepID=A0A6J4MMA4_9ACTN|nr:MAG: hypothetical protein AVDCRST_MAG36-2829 [uncultured Nocardioidaceae bacterium]